MNNKHPLTGRKSRAILMIVLAFVLCALMVVLAGCNEPATTTQEPEPEFKVPEGPADPTYGLNGETPTELSYFKYKDYEDGTIIITGTFVEANDLKKIVIPAVIDGKKVARVGESAFATLYRLEEIVFSGYIVDVQQYAFRDCRSLKTVKLSSCVARLHEGAFSGCRALTNLDFIVPSVKVLGSRIFEECAGLKKAVIPDTVEFVGTYTFLNCSYLESVKLPAGITEIPDRMFQGCSALKTTTDSTSAFIVPATVTSIGEFAFQGCNVKTFTMSEGIVSIGQGAFSNNERVRDITLPSTVTSIGDTAFANCKMLNTLTLPVADGAKLGKDLFVDSKKLATINVKAGTNLATYCSEWAETVKSLSGHVAITVNAQ
jgi:hypothetical protein